jgi:acetylornithine deacetylase/succinyl-diaminopimelate desuccinylase-like protein
VKPVRAAADHWFIRDAKELLETHFGKPAIVQPSSPASGTAHPFVEQLGAEIVGIGITHHGAMLHSPNENIIPEQFEAMIQCSAALFQRLKQRAEAGDISGEMESKS